MNLAGVKETIPGPEPSRPSSGANRREEESGFGAALWLALLGRGAQAFRAGESRTSPTAARAAGADLPAPRTEPQERMTLDPGFDPARLGEEPAAPRNRGSVSEAARTSDDPAAAEPEPGPRESGPAARAAERSAEPHAGEAALQGAAPVVRANGEGSGTGSALLLGTGRGRVAAAGVSAPALTAPPRPPAPVPGPRATGTFVIPFEDTAGQEGRIRLAVRGNALLATILSSSHDTLRRLGQGLGELSHALADRGFAESQVSVRPLRPSEPPAAPEREADPDRGTRRGTSHHQKGGEPDPSSDSPAAQESRS